MLQSKEFYVGLLVGAIAIYWWTGRSAKMAPHQGNQGG
jgi:hypothetical protein